jgi:hypothetical protein
LPALQEVFIDSHGLNIVMEYAQHGSLLDHVNRWILRPNRQVHENPGLPEFEARQVPYSNNLADWPFLLQYLCPHHAVASLQQDSIHTTSRQTSTYAERS